MSKTVEELAMDWWKQHSDGKDLQKWDTVNPIVAFLAGYEEAIRAAQKQYDDTVALLTSEANKNTWWIR